MLTSQEYGFDITRSDIAGMIKDKLHRDYGSYSVGAELARIECDVDSLSFEFFLLLVCDLKGRKEKQNYEKELVMSMSSLSKLLPLDPESTFRQCWDLLCMLLLLYCSFYVPFGIAFPDDSSGLGGGMSPVEAFGLAVDTVFMLDIGLSFVTAVEVEGVVVRDPRRIARRYARTWFAPDLAGSFPFDTVITALLDDGAGAAGSTNFIRALRLVRMLKLIRALKFLSRLNKLKTREGFEVLAPAIGISSSVFTLVFTAHLLGCFFTMLLDAQPPGANWLASYGPDLPAADAATRYVVALYWAMVSVTTMGYGDVVPVTHAERIFGLVTALVGAVVFSFCMGNVASLITQAR
jgi:potassium channel